MKKNLFLLLMLSCVVGSVKAQVYLTDALKPKDSYLYQDFPSKGPDVTVGRYPYKGGFEIRTGKSNILIATDKPGYAVFNLKGAYEKMTFVMGPSRQIGEDDNVIVTIKGDGSFLLDEVVSSHDAPKAFSIDVNGVDELRFDLPRGTVDVAFGELKLWKAGQTPVMPKDPMGKITVAKHKLVERIYPYFLKGRVTVIRKQRIEDDNTAESISINRVKYESGLQFTATQALLDHTEGCAYFWLQKKYDKLSFVVGPRDNQSSLASAWLTVKADGKIIYEKLVKQTDLAEQVVLDVSGVNQVSFSSIDEDQEFRGGIVFGAVDITVYPAGDTSVPEVGLANASKDKISQLPDVCKLCSNIPPYSVRGVGSYNNTYFDGASSHYTFSMGGEQFSEGFILTTGSTLFDDNINSFANFDLAGEYDWVSFTAGCLSKHRVLDDDRILVYADDRLILDTEVHPVMPNMHFELPINKCQRLRFVKPGTGAKKQTYIGIGDVLVYRGQVTDNNLFVHPRPDMPETVDLIDLTKGPYFHFVGRYLSTLTNFDFNDCFKNGSSQKEYFQMKDGSKIYKGIMLETNIPLGFEDAGIMDIVAGFFTPFGVLTGSTFLVQDGRQSSCAAFNVYNEYETCTFAVANKSVYVDEFEKTFGAGVAPPVEFKVYADTKLVGNFMVADNMQPATFTVPINKCEQLMFWLQCGDVRSGQYVIYDITLDKKPMSHPAEVVSNLKQEQVKLASKTEMKPAPKAPSGSKETKEKKEKKSRKKDAKEEEQIAWELNKRSSSREVDDFLGAVDEVWKATQEMISKSATNHRTEETYLQASDGSLYKAVSFVDDRGSKLSISGILAANAQFVAMKKNISNLGVNARVYLPNATLSLPNLGDKMIAFSRLVKTGNKAITQCNRQAEAIVAVKEMEDDLIHGLLDSALTVDGVASTDKVLLIPLAEGETVPQGASLQQIRYFNMD